MGIGVKNMADDTHTKLASAEFLHTGEIPGMGLWSSGMGRDTIDKYQFPKDYYKIVNLCNHYYRTDPLVSNTLNKIIDIGFKEYALDRAECSDEEYFVYSNANAKMVMHLRELGLEYALSGLLVPEVTWTTKAGNKIHPSLPPNKPYKVPEVLWVRDPSSLKLRKTPIPNKVIINVVISDDDIQFIQNKGIYPDGFEDKETYEMLVREYPNFVKAVEDGEREFKLDNPFLIRRFPLKDSPYPNPYLLPILEALEHKRNLRKMDYAIAARVITAIMLIKIGNDEYPLTEDDDDIVENLRKQMRYRNTSDNIERLFQLFANHTVDISWIMPDVAALLDNDKYESVNTDILFGLGFPRIVLVGETARTGTSQSEYALLSPAETIKSIRDTTLIWADEVYRRMKDRNSFENLPKAGFSEIRLYDLEKLMNVANLLYERGVLSRTSLARLGGFDFENIELPMREHELTLFENTELPEYPLMPFTNQAPGMEDNNSTPTTTE